MPTGYTADVATGKIIDFKDYALQCAHAFGACMDLRDDPISSEIPEFVASTHNTDRLNEAQKELAEFDAMTQDEQRLKWKESNAKTERYARERIAETNLQRARYEDMLAYARKFKSPSPSHEAYAKFLVSQLEGSIDFDCSTDFYEKQIAELEVNGFSRWRNERRKSLLRDIEFHAKAQLEENERTEKRNLWVFQLKQALGMEV